MTRDATEFYAPTVQAAVTEATAPDIRTFISPDDTRSWKSHREGDIEVFTAPDGVQWVRSRADEVPTARIVFTRYPGLSPMLLVRREESGNVKRAERAERRELKELRKRGLA